MKILEGVASVAVPLVGLVIPYVVKTHGKTKEILDIVKALADAAAGPEQK